jgi:hypothetical protein
MSDNFEQAVEYIYDYLYHLYDKGITRKDIESMSRSEMLRVFDDDFNWHDALENSESDYDAYDSLKRHCAFKIRTEQHLHRRLKEWIALVLEDRQPPPKREYRAKKTGKEHNFLLAALVKEVSLKYKLKPMRNAAAKVKRSACDAVSTAINQLPPERRLKPASYSRLAESYLHAVKVGHFSELILS